MLLHVPQFSVAGSKCGHLLAFAHFMPTGCKIFDSHTLYICMNNFKQMTDERWLDILARTLIKQADERRKLPDADIEPDGWTDEEFEEMEAWASDVFSVFKRG